MTDTKRKLSLDRPATYQIRVPGHLDDRWTAWDARLTVTAESTADGAPITLLTGTMDQAALQGLLRRLYALGLPLISAQCIDLDI
ncbi:MAG: hypothetical protein KC425_09980 [Anaerolineales bacterium]|nr:hypothetical protein [Anaerolineales bacterium]